MLSWRHVLQRHAREWSVLVCRSAGGGGGGGVTRALVFVGDDFSTVLILLRKVMFSRKERVKGGPPDAPSSLSTANKSVHTYINGKLQPKVRTRGQKTLPAPAPVPPPVFVRSTHAPPASPPKSSHCVCIGSLRSVGCVMMLMVIFAALC